MGMKEEAMRELARRELARRQEAQSGTPNVIEEMHEDISAADRMIVKNLSQSPEKSAAYLKRTNPQLDTRVWDGRVLVKKKNEKEWRALDPDTDFFSTDILYDAGDIVGDVGLGVAEGLAATGAAAAGLLGSGGLASVPAAMFAAAATGAAGEAIRQKVGDWAGLNQDIDWGDVALTGGISGVMPGLPSAAKKAVLGTKGAVKAGAKFLGGVDDKAIAGMTREGEKKIAKLETETVVPTIKKIAEGMGKKISDVDAERAQKVYQFKEQLNLADDAQVREVLEVEARAAIDAGNPSKAQNIRTMIKDLDETADVRKAIDEVGIEDVDTLRQTAFPQVKGTEELMEDIPKEMQDELFAELQAIRGMYGDVAETADMVDLKPVKDFYDKAIAKYENMKGNKAAKKVANALKKDFEEKFLKNNPNYSPEAAARAGITGMGMGSTKYAKDGVKTVMKDGKMVTKYAPEEATNFTDKLLFEQKIPYEEARFIKDQLGIAFDSVKQVAGSISDLSSAKGIAGYQRQATQILNKAMDAATSGGKSKLDPMYVQMDEMLGLAKKRFGDVDKARSTLDVIVKGGKKGRQYLRELKRIDEVTGTKYSEYMEEAIKAQAATVKGIDQAKLIGKANTLAENKAMAEMTPKQRVFSELKEVLTKSGKVNYKKAYKAMNEYAQNNDPLLTQSIDELAAKYGDDVAKDFKEAVDDIGLAAVFGDSEKTLINNIDKEQASNTLRGVLQGVTWQTGLGAGGAQIGGAIGKAIGAQVPIKKALRKTLPAYFEKKKALRELDDKTKKWLEKKVMDSVLTRRDLIRELSKKIATDKDRG